MIVILFSCRPAQLSVACFSILQVMESYAGKSPAVLLYSCFRVITLNYEYSIIPDVSYQCSKYVLYIAYDS